MNDKIVSIDDFRKHITASIACKSCGHKWIAVYPEEAKFLECPGCHVTVNEFGSPVSVHRCTACGSEFTVIPPAPGWQECLSDQCESYDPARDIDKMMDEGIDIIIE